ncbi:hypothetical protein N7456_010382 [Penicillium angulare]|uniref:Uncharacterized protein n=1 Tax=Penicillium angulare TaxID=116970 RepID=A0A9W9F6I3_9EURO|nr:hypothetical protein N7456_010382 [Penicillium angulare]
MQPNNSKPKPPRQSDGSKAAVGPHHEQHAIIGRHHGQVATLSGRYEQPAVMRRNQAPFDAYDYLASIPQQNSADLPLHSAERHGWGALPPLSGCFNAAQQKTPPKTATVTPRLSSGRTTSANTRNLSNNSPPYTVGDWRPFPGHSRAPREASVTAGDWRPFSDHPRAPWGASMAARAAPPSASALPSGWNEFDRQRPPMSSTHSTTQMRGRGSYPDDHHSLQTGSGSSRPAYHSHNTSVRMGPRTITNLLHPNSRKNHIPVPGHNRERSSLSRAVIIEGPVSDLEEQPARRHISSLTAEAQTFYPGRTQHGGPLTANPPQFHPGQLQHAPPLMEAAPSAHGHRIPYGYSSASRTGSYHEGRTPYNRPSEDFAAPPKTPTSLDGEYAEYAKYYDDEYYDNYSDGYGDKEYFDDDSDEYSDDYLFYSAPNARQMEAGTQRETLHAQNSIIFTTPGRPAGCSSLLTVGAVPDTPFRDYPGTFGEIRTTVPDPTVQISASAFPQTESQSESLRRAQVHAQNLLLQTDQQYQLREQSTFDGEQAAINPLAEQRTAELGATQSLYAQQNLAEQYAAGQRISREYAAEKQRLGLHDLTLPHGNIATRGTALSREESLSVVLPRHRDAWLNRGYRPISVLEEEWEGVIFRGPNMGMRLLNSPIDVSGLGLHVPSPPPQWGTFEAYFPSLDSASLRSFSPDRASVQRVNQRDHWPVVQNPLASHPNGMPQPGIESDVTRSPANSVTAAHALISHGNQLAETAVVAELANQSEVLTNSVFSATVIRDTEPCKKSVTSGSECARSRSASSASSYVPRRSCVSAPWRIHRRSHRPGRRFRRNNLAMFISNHAHPESFFEDPIGSSYVSNRIDWLV